MAKLKNSNCDKTKKKLWQNLKDQIVTKLKNWNCSKLKKINCSNSKTQIVKVIKITVVTEVVITRPRRPGFKGHPIEFMIILEPYLGPLFGTPMDLFGPIKT